MNRFFITAWLSLFGMGLAFPATTPMYINSVPINVPPDIAPQIDASVFVNQTQFRISDLGISPLPYETLNTRYFTNLPSGTMTGDPGFRFDFFTNNVRGAMDWWVNEGTIDVDTSGGLFIGSIFGITELGNWLLVDSSNIDVSGRMSAGSQGMIRLKGDNIKVRRTGLRTGQPPGGFPFFGGVLINGGSNYINDLGIFDLYWGAGTNNALDNSGTPMRLDLAVATNFFTSGQDFTLPDPASPFHQVIDSTFSGFRFTNTVSVPSPFFIGTNFFSGNKVYEAFAYTNQINATSAVIQVAFVPTNSVDTNYSVNVSFLPQFFGDEGATVVVEFSLKDFDIVTRQFTTNSLFLVDTLAFDTNVFLADNFSAPTQRPSTYELSRGQFFGGFGFGTRPNAAYSPSLIWNPSYETNFVDVFYAAYSAQVLPPTQNNVFAGINPALADPTNFSGRIEIIGDKVDLDQVRLRSESTIIIKAKDLSTNKLAQVEAPFLVYDLATTQPQLVITNLAPATVRRTSGAISAWSAIWNNRMTSILTNVVAGVTNVTTNVTELQFHTLIVDPALRTLQPVVVNEFSAKATNLVIGDALSIGKFMRLEGETLRVSLGLNLPAGTAWANTNIVGVMNLTNLGTINIPSSGFFGTDRAKAYSNLINRGTLSAASQLIRADRFENIGSQVSQGAGTVVARSGVIQLDTIEGVLSNSQMVANSDVTISADTLLVQQTQLRAGSNGFGSITLSVTNRLCDNAACDGSGLAGNEWFTSTGFRVTRLPLTSDLLGTSIESFIPLFREAVHVWPAEDRGLSPKGFTNNLALGRLVLDGEAETLFTFRGAGVSNALYVDYLELRNNATNFNLAGANAVLAIEPNLTIYFADSNVRADKLDGVAGGRLRWVSSYTGPNSSTNITYPSGTVYTFNAGVVRSKDLDSDGDGIVNYDDPTPLYVPENMDVTVEIDAGPPRVAMISWDSLFNSTNTLEYVTNVDSMAWMVLTNFVNGPFNMRITVDDVIAEGEERYYRVRVDPSGP